MACYKAWQLRLQMNATSKLVDGIWVPCRPSSYPISNIGSFFVWARHFLPRRIKAAIGVLFGVYDAVDWENKL